ncbi:MAG TPA: hypothetical protein VMY37_02035 [Thermoguttaceae bacterium]|nr:hypothetical protein [Thermoguttaceae bacterium]
MNDLAAEAKQDPALALIADDQPVIINPEAETARMHECEYCGHAPCGCGG